MELWIFPKWEGVVIFLIILSVPIVLFFNGQVVVPYRTELIANLKAVIIRDLQLEKSRSVIFTIALFLLVEISLHRLGLRLFYQYKKAE